MNRAEVERFVAAVQSAASSDEDRATITDGLRVLRNDDGAIVAAADLGAGGPASAFFARVEQEAERLRVDQALFGRAVVRDGRRVPPSEWPPMRLVWESGHRQRGDEIGSVGVHSRWPDPLSFIGRAANEGES